MAVTWTDEQKKVISLRDRNILVSAAAGSGKTAVLIERILGKILDKDNPIDVDRLLIMTFTRAAAGEMRERLCAALEKALYQEPDNEHLQRQMNLIHTAQITTIDGFCSYVIRNYFHLIDLDPGCRTAEEGELRLLREDVMKELLEDAYEQKDRKFIKLVECYAPGKSDEALKELVLKVYEAAMSHPFPEEWLKHCIQMYQVDTWEELKAADWMKLLWNEIEEDLLEANRLARRAIAICNEPYGPLPYEEALHADLQIIGTFWELVQKRDFAGIRKLTIVYKALSRKSVPDGDPVKKERVKKLRDEVKGIINGTTDKLFSCEPEDILEMVRLSREPLESLVQLVLEFWQRFARKKRDKNILDFTDMEHFALDILVKKEGEKLIPSQAARELSRKYDEVMIDEYQDSNLVQEMITSMVSGWAENKKNIFMVGDVKQSIYRFRLARPELFMEKYRTYSTEDSREQRIDLHKNFRSRHQVLDSVNYLFYRIMGADMGGITYDESSALYPGAQFPEGSGESFCKTQVLLIEKDGEELEDEKGSVTSQELEAIAIAGEIKRIVGREQVLDKETGAYRPVEYGDIVILLRSVYGWAEAFREVLISRGIPAYTTSRTGYFSAQEVVIILNYLRVCDNPLQDIPLTGVLYSPIVGCTVQELGLLRKKCPQGLIYESLCDFVKGQWEEEEEKALQVKLGAFLEQLQKLRSMAAYTPVHQLILHMMRITGYEEYVRALPGGSQRGANLRMLVEKAMDYEKTSYRGLFNFVRYIENLQKYQVDFGEVNVAEAGSGSVQIMTIHKSKGLEFPIVFAAGMGKQFNFQDLNARFLIHPELGFGVDVIQPEKRLIYGTPQKRVMRSVLKKESLGEELRVLYVALTRAKEKLYITGTVAKVDKLIDSLWYQRDEKAAVLPLGVRTGAKCFWDYILPALANHLSMNELYREQGFWGIRENPYHKEKAEFDIRVVTAENLVRAEIEDMADSRIREQVFENWDTSRVCDQEIRDALEERFGYVYPYGYLREMPVKVSVSELKKRSWQGEQDREDAVFFEPDIVPLIPRFVSGEQENFQGAARGTAYHRVMECLDYEKVGSLEEIKGQIENFAAQKKMTDQEAACVSVSDIRKFAEAPLGQRMKEASGRKQLFREQPFVMSVDVSELQKDWIGGEKVLVQGIIDGYFLEDDEIVLVDYKTDKVPNGDEKKLVELYHTQLEDYARALERLTGKKVKEKYIYSFTLGREISL